MNINDFIFINYNQLLKKNNMNMILNNFYNLKNIKNKKIIHFCTFCLSSSIIPDNINQILLNKYIFSYPKNIVNNLITSDDNNDKNINIDKISSFFFNSNLKENCIFYHKLNNNDYEENMIQNLFTLYYNNFTLKIYKSFVNNLPLQLNSFNIFPCDYKFNNLNIGIFLEKENKYMVNLEKVIKNYCQTKISSNLLNIQKKNKKLYEKYFEPDIYFSKLFNQIYKNMQNEIIFEIGTSSVNKKVIKLNNTKDYSKKWYIYPFGDTRTRFQKNIPFKIEYSKKHKIITITKINQNSKYLWGNGWKIPLKLWYPHDVSNFIIPQNYGTIKLNHIDRNYYKFGLVVPFFSRAIYVKKFLESLKDSDISNCIIVFMDESMTKDVNEDHFFVHHMIKNFDMPNLIKVFKNKHGNMFDSILTGWDMLYPYCKYLITLDSDTIMKKKWINTIHSTFKNIDNDYKNKFIICSGFNTENERHTVIERKEKYILKNSIGGCNMFFKKDIYPDYIRNTLISYKWDTNIISYINELGGIIGTTNPSVIQHIGEISSGHRLIESSLNYDKSNDFEK